MFCVHVHVHVFYCHDYNHVDTRRVLCIIQDKCTCTVYMYYRCTCTCITYVPSVIQAASTCKTIITLYMYMYMYMYMYTCTCIIQYTAINNYILTPCIGLKGSSSSCL